MAAKSLTQSTETKHELEGIKNRLSKVEKGEGSVSSGASQGSWDPWFRAKAERDTVRSENNWGNGSRFDMIGGTKGNMAIMGGFPKWSRTDKLKDWFEEIKIGLGPLSAEIKMMYPPGTRGHIIQLELVEKETIRATRLNILDFVKKVKAMGLKVKMGEEKFLIWASPSKPRDATSPGQRDNPSSTDPERTTKRQRRCRNPYRNQHIPKGGSGGEINLWCRETDPRVSSPFGKKF